MHEIKEKKAKQKIYNLLHDEISRGSNETPEDYKEKLLDLTEEIWEIIVQ